MGKVELEQASYHLDNATANRMILSGYKTRLSLDTESASVFRGIQSATPAYVVNHATQIASVLRGLADATSIKNGMAIGSWERVANGGISLGAGVLGASFRDIPRDNKQAAEEREMGLLPYMGYRVYEGLFQPHKHISQTIGVATMASCVFSLMAGLRVPLKGSRMVGKGYITDPALIWDDFIRIPSMIKGMVVEGLHGYKPTGNTYSPMELMNAPLGLVGGAALTFSPREEDGWRWYSGLMIARGITRIPKSVYDTTQFNKEPLSLDASFLDRYERYDPILGVTFHQIANLVGYLYGGVRKLPDGTVVRLDQLNDSDPPVVLTESKPATKIAAPAYPQPQRLASVQPVKSAIA